MSYALRHRLVTWLAAGLAMAACAAAPAIPPAGLPADSAMASGEATDTLAREAVEPPPRPAGYLAIPIDSGAPFRRLVRALGSDRLTLLLKINRVDLDHVRAGDTLFLPADTTVQWLDAAPFPRRLDVVDTLPKLLVVSQTTQAVAAYEYGLLVFWGPTSTGKRATPTPNGWYNTNWKAKETRSTDNDAWLLRWYFNFENQRGFSFHQYDLPGTPASHACVRLLKDDAEWIYRWADQWEVSSNGAHVLRPGTPVLVFGEFPYRDGAPWRKLGEDPAAGTVTADAIAEAIRRFRPAPPATDSTS